MPSAAAPSCVISEAPSTLPGEAKATAAAPLSEDIPRACTEFLFRAGHTNATATVTKTIAEPPIAHVLRAVIRSSPVVLFGHRKERLYDPRIPAIVHRESRQQRFSHLPQLAFEEFD